MSAPEGVVYAPAFIPSDDAGMFFHESSAMKSLYALSGLRALLDAGFTTVRDAREPGRGVRRGRPQARDRAGADHEVSDVRLSAYARRHGGACRDERPGPVVPPPGDRRGGLAGRDPGPRSARRTARVLAGADPRWSLLDLRRAI